MIRGLGRAVLVIAPSVALACASDPSAPVTVTSDASVASDAEGFEASDGAPVVSTPPPTIDASEASAATSSPWTDLGAVPVADAGATPELALPWGSGQSGFAVEVTAAPFQCFQMTELEDATGHLYVGPGEDGPYCTACEQRVSVGAGAALFVLPSGDTPFAPRSPLKFRFGLRDCDTLTSLIEGSDAAAPVTLSVRQRALPSPPSQGVLPVRLVVTRGSLFDDPSITATLDDLLTAVNHELAPAEITVTWGPPTFITDARSADATFSRGDPWPLTALWDAPAPDASAAPTLTVVLAGCLLLTDSITGTTSEPEGYTPHIPGGAGPADAVFIKGALCGTPTPVTVAWASSTLGRVLAHEIGHYLGLYHSVEADGTTDALADTSAANLMYYEPSVATATGLSASQSLVMRRHPLVLSAANPDL